MCVPGTYLLPASFLPVGHRLHHTGSIPADSRARKFYYSIQADIIICYRMAKKIEHWPSPRVEHRDLELPANDETLFDRHAHQ